jgi:phage shock protein PspC (stress-responsive transcriptional regulator)
MTMSGPLIRCSDPKLAGVCGGLAQWLDLDPTAVRVVWALGTFFTGVMPGFALYAVLWLLMPDANSGATSSGVLALSRKHRMIFGVCGGFADWLGWDPTVVRITYVVFSVLSAAFPGTIAYIILWAVMPRADELHQTPY